MNRVVALCSVIAAALAAASAAAAAPLQAVAVGRLAFPDRAYVVDLGGPGTLDASSVRVTENGMPVRHVRVHPLAASGLSYGVVLALDASDSMSGAPALAALDAARSFAARAPRDERIGVIAFNGSIDVVHAPTGDRAALSHALAQLTDLSYGTRILDAVTSSVRMLSRAGVSSGAVVLLSDGADVGSRATLDRALAAARAQHVRVFTVGLRSAAFDATLLRRIARSTGGAYAEAASPVELDRIYTAIGAQLGTEYVVEYRSTAPPSTHVDVRVHVDGAGTVAASYTTSQRRPTAFHRSLLSRFVLSPASLVLLGILVAWLIGWLVHNLVGRRRSGLVERVRAFAEGDPAPVAAAPPRQRSSRAAAATSRHARGWLAKLERDLELARIGIPALQVVAATAALTVVLAFVLALASPVFAVVALLVPIGMRAVVSAKLRRVRSEFADQLPPNLQVLASALRAGHSFLGAFTSTVDNAREPSRSELARVVNDERLGVPMDEAIRRAADRMANRDLEQVALLAELARTTGGNSAEVLDVVVATIRERADVRALVRTLTAQGRMARWILTALPVVTALGFYAIEPDVMSPMLNSSFGQVVFVLAGGMVVAGSIAIQRIVDIEI